MNNIKIDNTIVPIDEKDFKDLCDNFKKRIIRILYLKEDLENSKINDYDMSSYINALVWDIYGAYMISNSYKFLNCICELKGIQEHIDDSFTRKKILDLANFISSIGNKKE